MRYFARLLLLIFTFTLVSFSMIACSGGDDLPDNPPVDRGYFVAVTHSENYGYDYVSAYANALGGDTFSNLIPQRAVRVDVVNYNTFTPDGQPIVASGTVAYPVDGEIKGVVIAMHPTVMSDAEVPSSTIFTNDAVFAALGYMVVSPDMLGFGATRSLPHPYTHAESMARAGIDNYFAAKEYMAYVLERRFVDEVLIEGYSLGGYGAIAVQKEAESKYADKINIRRVVAGGGPYSLFDSMQFFLASPESDFPCGVVATILGLDYADNLALDLSKIFREPLLSNYRQWFQSKSYNSVQLNERLSKNLNSFMLLDEFNDANPEYVKLKGSLIANSLVEDWQPVAPISFIHAENDNYVPYVNASLIYDRFVSLVGGRQVTLNTADGDHIDAATPFFTAVVMFLL